MKYFHCADNNTLGSNDCFEKDNTNYDIMNNCFVRNFPMSQDLSMDESMIP